MFMLMQIRTHTQLLFSYFTPKQFKPFTIQSLSFIIETELRWRKAFDETKYRKKTNEIRNKDRFDHFVNEMNEICMVYIHDNKIKYNTMHRVDLRF